MIGKFFRAFSNDWKKFSAQGERKGNARGKRKGGGREGRGRNAGGGKLQEYLECRCADSKAGWGVDATLISGKNRTRECKGWNFHGAVPSSMPPSGPDRPCHRSPDGTHREEEDGHGQFQFPFLAGLGFQQADSGPYRMVADPYRRTQPVGGNGRVGLFPRIVLHGESRCRAKDFFRPEPPLPDLVSVNHFRLPEFVAERTIRVLGLAGRFVPPNPNASDSTADHRPAVRCQPPAALPDKHEAGEETCRDGQGKEQGPESGARLYPHRHDANHQEDARKLHPSRDLPHGFAPALAAQPGRFECVLVLLHFMQGGEEQGNAPLLSKKSKHFGVGMGSSPRKTSLQMAGEGVNSFRALAQGKRKASPIPIRPRKVRGIAGKTQWGTWGPTISFHRVGVQRRCRMEGMKRGDMRVTAQYLRPRSFREAPKW